MAFTDPITMNDNSSVLQTFTRTGQIQNGSDWVENDSILTDKRSILLRHSNAGPSKIKGAKPLRRHLVQMIHEKWNSTLGITDKATLNLTVTVDGASTITSTDLYNMLAMVKNFLTTGNLDKILRDET